MWAPGLRPVSDPCEGDDALLGGETAAGPERAGSDAVHAELKTNAAVASEGMSPESGQSELSTDVGVGSKGASPESGRDAGTSSETAHLEVSQDTDCPRVGVRRFRIGWRRQDATCSSKFGCRWTMYLSMAILLATVLLSGCSTSSSATGSGSVEAGSQGFVAGDGSLTLLDPQDRQPAPELSGETLEGTDFSLSDHLGEVVVLNVWASWCAPCRSEAPALSSVWNDTKDQDVQFVGLVTRDSTASAQAFAKQFDLGYPHLLDDDGSLQLLFRHSLPPQAIPSTLVVDKKGRVAGRALGEISESSLRGFIEPLLNEDQAG